MSSIIFYGAGKNASDNFERWKAAGIIPVCFADASSDKHYTKYIDTDNEEYDILPLGEAINKYPDYDLYVTLHYSHLADTVEYLKTDCAIPEERIKFPDPVEYRFGCHYLTGICLLNADTVYVCCDWGGHQPRIERSGDITADIQNILKLERSINNSLLKNEDTPCEGCAYLSKGYWPAEFILRSVTFGYPQTCNFKCCYCTIPTKGKTDLLYEKMILDDLLFLAENHNNLMITLSNGEIAVNRYRREIMSVFLNKRNNVRLSHLITNASVYIEEICDIPVDMISISPDSGTRETFKKIKGVDLFDKVVENVSKYTRLGKRVCLKYIILENINDNKADIDGFIDVAVKTGVRDVRLANNIWLNNSKLSGNAIDMLLRLIDKANQHKLSISIEYGLFHTGDLARLNAAIPCT